MAFFGVWVFIHQRLNVCCCHSFTAFLLRYGTNSEAEQAMSWKNRLQEMVFSLWSVGTSSAVIHTQQLVLPLLHAQAFFIQIYSGGSSLVEDSTFQKTRAKRPCFPLTLQVCILSGGCGISGGANHCDCKVPVALDWVLPPWL